MGIAWEKKVYSTDDNGNQTNSWEDNGVTYEGCVISPSYVRCVRVMSDIYSDERYCKVIDPDTLKTKEVHVGGAFECNTYHGTVTPDISDDLRARYEAKCEAAAAARRVANEKAEAARREEQAEQEAYDFDVGDRVLVYKGRKVPVGTEGVVIRFFDGNYGLRAGIKDDAGEVHWTATSNVRKVVSKPEGLTWTEYMIGQRAAEKAREATLPVKGQQATILSGDNAGKSGIVFWERDGRVGIATSNRKDASGKNLDVAWEAATNCHRFTEAEQIAAAEQIAQANKDEAATKKAAKKARKAELDEVECPF